MPGIINIIGESGRMKTLADHYGFKNEEFDVFQKEILCDIIKAEEFQQVLDKHFKKSDNEVRLKVVAFFEAMKDWSFMNGTIRRP